MPGTGVFRFSVTRESVDSSEYDGWILEVKEAHQEAMTDVFKKRIIFSPDKKIITEILKKGKVVDGFKLKPKFEKFEFKGE